MGKCGIKASGRLRIFYFENKKNKKQKIDHVDSSEIYAPHVTIVHIADRTGRRHEVDEGGAQTQ